MCCDAHLRQRDACCVCDVQSRRKQCARYHLAAQKGALKSNAFFVAERDDLNLRPSAQARRPDISARQESRTGQRNELPGASSRSAALSADMATTTPKAPS
jgi:hypothetical protein